MIWLTDLLEAYRRVRSNEYERQKEISSRLRGLSSDGNGDPTDRLELQPPKLAVAGSSPAGPATLSWREQDRLDRVTIGEYRGPRRPFWGSRSGR